MRHIFTTSSASSRRQAERMVALPDADQPMSPGVGLRAALRAGSTPERHRTLSDAFAGFQSRPTQPYNPWSTPRRPDSPGAASPLQTYDPFGDLPSTDMPEHPRIQQHPHQSSNSYVEASRQFAVTHEEAYHSSGLPMTPAMTLSALPSREDSSVSWTDPNDLNDFIAPLESFREQPNQSMETLWEVPDDNAVNDFMASDGPDLEPPSFSGLQQSRFDFAPRNRTAPETPQGATIDINSVQDNFFAHAPGGSQRHSRLHDLMPSPVPERTLAAALAQNVAETAPGATIGIRAVSLPQQRIMSSLPRDPSASSAAEPESHASASSAAQDAPQTGLRPLLGLPRMPQTGLGPLLLPDSATYAAPSAQTGLREPSTVADSSQHRLRPAPMSLSAMMSSASPGIPNEFYIGEEVPVTFANESMSDRQETPPEPMSWLNDFSDGFRVPPSPDQASSQDERPRSTSTHAEWMHPRSP